MRQTFDRKNLKILVLFVIAVLVWHAAAADGSDGLAGKLLTVTFIDVGQGDSILAELACGKNMLIDAGGVMGSDSKNSYIGEKIVTAFLHRKGINKLDLLVLTHPHEDHAGGLTALLENIKVETVIDSGQLSSTRAYHNFLKLIKKNEIKYRLGRCGQVLNFGDGIQGWILSPLEPFLEGTNSDLNNNSIVIRLLYNKVGFMFTGDLEREGEARILAAGLPLFSQILKAGHHGSQTASGSEFLDSVKPQIAVISVGTNNQFHHPHKPVLERLKERAIKIYRTDQQGAVTVKTDGERYMVETAK